MNEPICQNEPIFLLVFLRVWRSESSWHNGMRTCIRVFFLYIIFVLHFLKVTCKHDWLEIPIPRYIRAVWQKWEMKGRTVSRGPPLFVGASALVHKHDGAWISNKESPHKHNYVYSGPPEISDQRCVSKMKCTKLLRRWKDIPQLVLSTPLFDGSTFACKRAKAWNLNIEHRHKQTKNIILEIA